MPKKYHGKKTSEFDFKFVLYEKSGTTATVTLNRPKVLNCVNYETLLELQTAFHDASYDDAVRVVIMTGAGDKAFCTGADMAEQQQFLEERSYWKWMGEFIKAHEAMRNIGKPMIARLNGIVVGGGNEFNMSCDLAIAADDIYIRHVGASHGSVAAAGATQWLPIMIGDRRARQMLMLNEEIPAAQALEWGLINEVVPRANLDAAVEAMAEKLSNKFPEIMRYTKEQLNFWKTMSWHLTIGHARDWLDIHSQSAEVAEGVTAFKEKRKPDYRKFKK